MPGFNLLSFLALAALLAFGAYVFRQASRSREADLRWRLRKCEIALHDAEQTLQNTERYFRAEVARLKARLGDTVGEPGAAPSQVAAQDTGDGRFRRAKNAFARRFHPDHADGDRRERQLRAEIFKEFWEELERIERRR